MSLLSATVSQQASRTLPTKSHDQNCRPARMSSNDVRLVPDTPKSSSGSDPCLLSSQSRKLVRSSSGILSPYMTIWVCTVTDLLQISAECLIKRIMFLQRTKRKARRDIGTFACQRVELMYHSEHQWAQYKSMYAITSLCLTKRSSEQWLDHSCQEKL